MLTLLVIASGTLIGFVFAMPVAGPVGALLWSRVLSGQLRNGLFLGLGSAVAEGTYAGVSALLAGKALGQLMPYVGWAQLVGAAVLIGVGVMLVTRKPSSPTTAPQRNGAFALGFVLSGANPALLVSWTGAITTLHALEVVTLNTADALPFGVGAALGLSGWYATVVAVVRKNQALLTPPRVASVLRALGWLVIVIGVAAAVQFLWTRVTG